jgi:lauroyl/myristoyl acyltransferase
VSDSPPHLLRRTLNRLSIYGDFWLRCLALGARGLPWYLEPVFVALYTSLFYLTCVPARRAILANLAVLFPEAGPLERHRKAFRVIWNFAWSLADAAHVRTGHHVLDWEIQGLEHLQPLASDSQGALILTAHMGNYDLAAPLFAARLNRPLHMVRVPERHAESQAYASRNRHYSPTAQCVIHYNEPGNMLAIKLAGLLRDNQIIAIQGDRILFDVAATTLAFSDTHTWNLPKGPFLLGLISRCPILPLFITRVAWRRYRITAYPCFEWPDGRIDKDLALASVAQWWSDLLAQTVRREWHQWFVFEPAFSPRIPLPDAPLPS